MKIRALAPEDSLEELTRLLHAAYASLVAQGWNFTAASQSVETTRERLAGAQCWVALTPQGRMVGTITARGPKAAGEDYIGDPSPALFTQKDTALLSQLAVHPDCRGQGLGERLLDEAEAWACAQGYARIALDTAEPARALRERYARRGFEPAGHVQWSGKTYASVLMCKSLTILSP